MKRHWLLTRHSRVELYVPNLIGDPCPKSQSHFSSASAAKLSCYTCLVRNEGSCSVQAMCVWRAPCEPLRLLSPGLWSASLGTFWGAVTTFTPLNSTHLPVV